MGSFGGEAGLIERPSGNFPGRSMILGLLGACLGIRREDDAGLKSLDRLRVTIGVLQDGGFLRDFHTMQGVPDKAIRNPHTRREALSALRASDNASLSIRDYRTDCAFSVAIGGSDRPHDLVDALRKPVFIPSLGRRSCPLSLPMHPHVVVADDQIDALRAQPLPHGMDGLWLRYAISDDPIKRADCLVHYESHRDCAIDRSHWHFRSRRACHIQFAES